MSGEDASAVFDTAIKLTAIYHIIEWIRTTLLLTVVGIGANIMHVWYGSGIIALYGAASYIYLIVVYFSPQGKACGETQDSRYKWMLVEMVYFFVVFPCY